VTAVSRFFSPRRIGVTAALLLLLAVPLAFCACYRIWSLHDLRVYRTMIRECHPVCEELHWGRVRPGQEVEEVIGATKPLGVERYGPFVRLSYQQGLSFSGVTIVAKNGRLAGASAWSCTWDRVFFNTLTDEDQQAFRDAHEAHREALRQRRRGE
jgi:hypothetical protein